MTIDRLHQDEQTAHRQDRDPRAGQELGHQHHDQHRTGGDEADGVDHPRADHPAAFLRVVLGAQQPGPVPDHADLAERERHEHAHDVELDEGGYLSPESHHEGDRGQGQEHDAVGERQPVTAGMQLMREVAVLRQNRAEHREAVERGIGRQHQDQGGDAGDQIEARGEIVKDRIRQLGHQRLLPIPLGSADELLGGALGQLHTGLDRQHDHAQEERNRDSAQQGKCGGRVAGLGLAEGRHAVADRLDTGECRTPRRERPGHQEHQRKTQHVTVLGMQFEARRLSLQIVAHHEDLDETPDQHDEHTDHEGVGGDREGCARFADTAQVDRGQQHDRGDRERHLVLGDERHRRTDIGHRRGHRDRDRQRVVHQERAGHRQPSGVSEVGGDHLVVAAAGRVGVHILAVGGHHHQHDQRDGHADPGRHGDRGQARDRQNQEDLLRRVGHRRQCIGGEYRQGDGLRQQGVAQLVAAERLSQEKPPRHLRKLGHESQE